MENNNTINNHNADESVNTQGDLIKITENVLYEAQASLINKETISIPIDELATLGTGFASLLPSLRAITQKASFETGGLYRLANASAGDVLKVAKNGNFWGAFKTAEGGSKFVQLKSVDGISTTVKTVAPINPVTIMMAVALLSIEKELKDIQKTCTKIITFLVNEKESNIKADVETLLSIISKYRYNFINQVFINSNHKMVLDVQKTARANMNFYQEELKGIAESKKFMLAHSQVESEYRDLLRKVRYYRLSLYSFSLASLLEVLFSGNYTEEYIATIKNEITQRSSTYRQIFEKCSIYLEKKSNHTLDTQLLKGIGHVGNAAGNAIGAIPLINKGPVDEFLQDGGKAITKKADDTERGVIKTFGAMNNPNISVFIEKLNAMIAIYNHTSEICFDDDNIYLITEA